MITNTNDWHLELEDVADEVLLDYHVRHADAPLHLALDMLAGIEASLELLERRGEIEAKRSHARKPTI